MEIIELAPGCVYVKIDGMMTFHARMGFLAGSRFEPLGQNGVAHLTEHLTSISQIGDDNNCFDPFFYVSEINAMTLREIAPAWINTTREFSDRTLLTLSKILNIHEFDKTIFKVEKKVVRGATLQWEKCKDAYEKVFCHLYETIFGPEHAFSKDNVGGSKDCKNLTIEQCFQFYKKNYIGKKRSLVIYGGVDESYLKGKIEELGLVNNDSKLLAETLPLPDYKPQTRKIKYDTQTPEIISALRIDSEKLRGTPMLELVSLILGGANERSVLYKQLREVHQVAYDTRTHLHMYSDTALFLIYYGLSEGENSDKVVKIVSNLIEEIDRYVSKEEFEVFKIALIERTKLNLEIPVKSTDFFTSHILTGRPVYTIENYTDSVKKLQYQDFLALFKNELALHKATTVVLE